MGICEDVERVRRAHLNDMGRWHIPCSSLVDPDPNWIRILATIENRGKIRLDWLIKKLTILIGEFSSGAIIFVLLKEMFKLKIVIFKFAHILFKINNVTVWKRLGSGSKYFRIRIPVLCQFFLSYRRGSGTIICDRWRFVCFDREHLPLLDAGPALPLHQPLPGHRQPPLQVSYTSIF